jgi:hypothetical protein
MAMPSASSTLVQTTVTGAAQVSGSTALAVSAIGLSGVLGMIAGGLYKIHVVDKPQVEVLQQAEQREARTAEIDEHRKTLDLIQSVRLAEEELARKDADTAERERQLEQIAANYKHEIGELRKQIDVMGRRKKVEYRDGVQGSGRSEGTRSQQTKEIIRLKAQLQRSNQSDELRVRHTGKVESLEQQLKACRAKLSKVEEHRERCICTTCQESDQGHSGDTTRATEPPNHYSLESEDEDSAEPDEDSNDFSEPEENSDLPGSGYEMAILKPATARFELERDIRSAVQGAQQPTQIAKGWIGWLLSPNLIF